jgi:hypothetical protein
MKPEKMNTSAIKPLCNPHQIVITADIDVINRRQKDEIRVVRKNKI